MFVTRTSKKNDPPLSGGSFSLSDFAHDEYKKNHETKRTQQQAMDATDLYG